MNGFQLLFLTSTVVLVQAVQGSTPLHQAVRARDLDTVRDIVEMRLGSDLDVATEQGITPMHLAAATDQTEIMELLMSRGASLHSITQHGFSPLHWAASRESIDSMIVLLSAGADIDMRAQNQVTPLHWAASRNAGEAVQLLLQAGADPSARTTSGETPLQLAVRNGPYSQAAILLADYQLEHGEEGPIGDLPTAELEFSAGDESAITARPGLSFHVPLGSGEHLSFVWLEELDIWFGQYEVTNGQYRRSVPRHNSRSIEGFSLNADDQPAVYVSWEDAQRYCEWLNEHFADRIPEGYAFRLPQEFEWMYAASTGEHRKYPWGDAWPPVYGNYSDETAREKLSHWQGIEGYEDGYVVTAPVRHSGMNELGIFGLGGNVWEWMLDWYDADRKQHRVRKGGSWDFDPRESLRIVARGMDRPDTRAETIGFRIVVGPRQ